MASIPAGWPEGGSAIRLELFADALACYQRLAGVRWRTENQRGRGGRLWAFAPTTWWGAMPPPGRTTFSCSRVIPGCRRLVARVGASPREVTFARFRAASRRISSSAAGPSRSAKVALGFVEHAGRGVVVGRGGPRARPGKPNLRHQETVILTTVLLDMPPAGADVRNAHIKSSTVEMEGRSDDNRSNRSSNPGAGCRDATRHSRCARLPHHRFASARKLKGEGR